MLTKRKRNGLLLFIGISILAVAGWQFYKYRLIDKKIKEVTEKTKGLYSIRYESLTLDETSGTLHIRNIGITPDTAVFNSMVQNNKAPSILIRANIPALDVFGVKTPKALLTKQIEGRSISITNPSIEILLNHFGKDTTIHNPSRDLSQELLSKLAKISIDSVQLTHGDVTVRDMEEKEAAFKGNDVSFLLSGFDLDSLAIYDSSRVLFAREARIHCAGLELPSKNKKYRLQIGQLTYASRGDALSVGQFRLIPRLSEKAFAASYPVSKDRYDFSLEDIRLLHISRSGIWHKRIEADSLVIGQSSFKIYRDLSYPHDTISKVGKYPQQQLMRLPVELSIHHVVLNRSFIEYKERNARSDSAGKLQFTDVTARIRNVTNQRKDIARNNKCLLLFKAKLLDKSPVDAQLTMLLNDPKGRFTIKGTIGAIDAPSLNPLTRPMGLARMEKGQVDRLHFEFRGDDSAAGGSLTMLYRDVKISLLKKDKKEEKLNKKTLPTLAANLFMRHSNPEEGRSPRTVEVHFNRILNKSFFNLVWKSIFSGIKQTVGMK